MKLKQILISSTVVLFLAGCTDSTADSKQPTASEIEQGKQRRLSAIDKMQIPEAAKEKMRAQVNGGNPATTAPTRK